MENYPNWRLDEELKVNFRMFNLSSYTSRDLHENKNITNNVFLSLHGQNNFSLSKVPWPPPPDSASEDFNIYLLEGHFESFKPTKPGPLVDSTLDTCNIIFIGLFLTGGAKPNVLTKKLLPKAENWSRNGPMELVMEWANTPLAGAQWIANRVASIRVQSHIDGIVEDLNINLPNG